MSTKIGKVADALYMRLAATASLTGLHHAQVREQVVEVVLGVLDDPEVTESVLARLVAIGHLEVETEADPDTPLTWRMGGVS